MSAISDHLHACGVTLLVASGAFAVSACGDARDAREGVEQVSESVCVGNWFYGSDTMKTLVTAALTAQGLGSSLIYPGNGSGAGENGMRGTNSDCNGVPVGTVFRQLSAPMSRDLTGGCTIATGDALQSMRVGLDGILALTANSNTETNISTADLAKAFCSAPAPPAGTCAASLVINGRTYTRFYRRDNLSGTTDTLKAQLGCSALCPADSAHIIVDDSYRPSPCTAFDTDTQCIGVLTGSNAGATSGTFVLGYAGLGERLITTPARELTVNSVSPSDANIRNLSYPLSRFLYINYNKDMLGRSVSSIPSATNPTANEKKFLCENFLGNDPFLGCAIGVDRTFAFESLLISNDFLPCNATTGPFDCLIPGAAPLACP